MESKAAGLTLNNRVFTASELLSFCKEKIVGSDSPEWELDVYRFILDFLSDSDYVSQKTSGTTGAPKTIRLSKQTMYKSAQLTTTFFGLKRDQLAVLCLPVQYIAGKMMVVRALYAGLKLFLSEPSSSPDFLGLEKIDFCAMVPMQASNLLEQKKWPPVKTVILGGAETNPNLASRLQQENSQVYETYGMAETCSHVALKRLTGDCPENWFSALPGVKLEQDKRGCLIIEAPFLPEKVVTNDCVQFKSETQFKWTGRYDNLINTGGIKVQPEELEEKISKILHLPSALIGQPDQKLGYKITLFVETEEDLVLSDVVAKLAPQMKKNTLPKTLYCIKRLPRNQFFKIKRTELRKLLN